MATNKSRGTASAKPARRVPPSRGQMHEQRAGTFQEPVAETTGRIKVKATEMGFYGSARRRPGDVFYIEQQSEFSPRWMTVVDERTPLKSTGAQDSINQKHDEILGGKAERAERREDDDDIE